jgi:adenylate cyclase
MAALEIQEELETFNFHRASRSDPPVQVGIGINTGPVVAGYLGSSLTMSYSVIGDTVNMASRLCGAANAGEIIIAEYTHHIVKDFFKIRPCKPVHVKGKEHAIQAYSVTGIRRRMPYGIAGLQKEPTAQ